MPRPANDPLRRSMETYRRRRPRAPTTRDRLVATGSRLALVSAISLVFAGVLVLGASVGHHAAGSAGGKSAAGLPLARWQRSSPAPATSANVYAATTATTVAASLAHYPERVYVPDSTDVGMVEVIDPATYSVIARVKV